MRPDISISTVRRLSAYYRVLRELEGEGIAVAPSQLLADRSGAAPSQLRKDLSCFGHFGTRGRGYAVASLTRELRSILGRDISDADPAKVGQVWDVDMAIELEALSFSLRLLAGR